VRAIADKAYDRDPLRQRLQRRGIELICQGAGGSGESACDIL
jgi:hypothetical protein